MSHTYLVAEVEVHDENAFKTYQSLSGVAMEKYGAELHLRGGVVDVLEGDWRPKSVVALKFASTDAARGFWNSPEYRKAREARRDISTMRVVMIEE